MMFINQLGKGSKKKYGKFHIGPDPPPGYGKKIIFFLKLDHFLRTFCKSVFLPLKIKK